MPYEEENSPAATYQTNPCYRIKRAGSYREHFKLDSVVEGSVGSSRRRGVGGVLYTYAARGCSMTGHGGARSRQRHGHAWPRQSTYAISCSQRGGAWPFIACSRSGRIRDLPSLPCQAHQAFLPSRAVGIGTDGPAPCVIGVRECLDSPQ